MSEYSVLASGISDPLQMAEASLVSGTMANTDFKRQVSDDGMQVNNTDRPNHTDRNRGSMSTEEETMPTTRLSLVTDEQAIVHLIKSSLGTGILAMPFAFSKAGLVGGMIGTAGVSLIYTYCVHIMVRSAQELCQRHDIESLDFANLVNVAFQRGPERIQRYAGVMRWALQFFLVAMTMSACCVYTVFIAASLLEVAQDWLDETVNLRLGVAILTPVLLIICMVRGMRHISPFSLISNILILSAVAIILWFVFSESLPSVTERPAFAPITALPIFLSTSTFAIAGITVVMPLENSMKHPEHFLGCARVLTTAMTLIAAVYAALGFFGYLKYGEDIEASISLNLPQDSPLSKSANIMLSIAIMLTYPLVLQCCVEFTWPGLRRRLHLTFNRLSEATAERLYRISLVIFHSLVAALVPNLGALMSLSGALFTVAVAFLLPPVLETVVRWESLNGTKLILTSIKNAIIVLFGLTVAITGSVTSVHDIIQAFSHNQTLVSIVNDI